MTLSSELSEIVLHIKRCVNFALHHQTQSNDIIYYKHPNYKQFQHNNYTNMLKRAAALLIHNDLSQECHQLLVQVTGTSTYEVSNDYALMCTKVNLYLFLYL